MATPPTNLSPNPVLTATDFVVARDNGWADAGWFFSRARARLVAKRLRALPLKDQEHRLAQAREFLREGSLHPGTAHAWLSTIQNGMDAVCDVLEDSADGTQAQVLRTSLPTPLWDGLVSDQERLDLMDQVRDEIRRGADGLAS